MPAPAVNRIILEFSHTQVESREATSLLRDHTCATHMHQGGADIRYVQEPSGAR